MDEPTTGIDNITLQNLVRLLKALTTGETEMTIILIDHDIEGFIGRVAGSIAVLENGKIVDRGTHDELCAKEGLYQRLVQAAKDPEDVAKKKEPATVGEKEPPKP